MGVLIPIAFLIIDLLVLLALRVLVLLALDYDGKVVVVVPLMVVKVVK